MGKRKALIIWGGWDGHEPEPVSAVFSKILKAEGFDVEVSSSMDALLDKEKMAALSLLIPVVTMSSITNEQCRGAMEAVESGVGIAGCHGGMCDSFRENVDWQFMTGGQWVSHPGGDGVSYKVDVKRGSSPITEGIPDFAVSSEQYYMHVDPAIEVLATTHLPVFPGPHTTNGAVAMPVVWTKRWGQGRVFYNSLGHHADIFDIPEARELMRRGFLWAAKKEA